MAQESNTAVLIVGAGPVGLTLAMDLAWRGVDVTVIERRDRAEPPPPKCNHVSARTMEIFRRLGVAGKLRNAGLPSEYPNDVSYRTSFTGVELSRILIPCRRDRYDSKTGPDTDWPTPEPPHRINQIYLEPILFDHAAQVPGLTILTRTEVESVSQSATEARVVTRGLDSGEQRHFTCQYLVGCDGGSSLVRKAIGAKFGGDPVVQRVQSTYFRSKSLIDLQDEEPAWATFSLNPRRSGNVYAIDGRETWIIHNYLNDDETDFESVDRDWALRTILGVNDRFEYEILAKEDWFGRRLVADKFRDRRIFIAGDSAHIWVPFAGYGMNAGIADAMNLSWLLAAHLNGWAAESILDAYESERLPITQQVSQYAMNHAIAMTGQRAIVPENIEDQDEAGRQARADLGEQAYALNVQQYCCSGLNFGYFYDKSPIISYDGEVQPDYAMAEYTPSSVPGCRVPHMMIGSGRSLYDALGPEYTLLRRDRSIACDSLMHAASKAGVPLSLLDIEYPQASGLYSHNLTIARPDQHVAWRGDAAPDDSAQLMGLLRGCQPN